MNLFECLNIDRFNGFRDILLAVTFKLSGLYGTIGAITTRRVTRLGDRHF
jgi:hypothetical protein